MNCCWEKKPTTISMSQVWHNHRQKGERRGKETLNYYVHVLNDNYYVHIIFILFLLVLLSLWLAVREKQLKRQQLHEQQLRKKEKDQSHNRKYL